MFCKNCGQRLKEDALFCNICGYKVIANNTTKKETSSTPWVDKHRKGIAKAGFIVFVLLILYGFGNASSSSTATSSPVPILPSATPIATPQVNGFDTQSVVNLLCNNQNGGSGTIITKDGYVLTNNHVIAGATSCLVSLPDTTTGSPKEIYVGTPIIYPGLSTQYDIAMVNINNAYTDSDGKIWGNYPRSFPTFTISDVCKNYIPSLGDSVRIYGYPVTSGGYNLTITDGIISSFADDGSILTSAKIDSGNSGGFAVSQSGCWLGIPSAVVSGHYQNLGVIIPLSIISEFADKISSQ